MVMLLESMRMPSCSFRQEHLAEANLSMLSADRRSRSFGYPKRESNASILAAMAVSIYRCTSAIRVSSTYGLWGVLTGMSDPYTNTPLLMESATACM